ncbi:synaptobrevin domain-containing protein [Cavenderia fasciculata]|uniref:Synaptobrevin domain-containing protein n=1 Tax=Cavenderia fasciculata TaxID=261658 RepID=F4PW21_CACFS|nr:synaptobrevin domain-containing protein [Cavenderia fasciculata]EGG20185.1 synaptobrevin domain-containing protein [Cavenderia fasciculata]|eukprot:XP_004367168.1 synaptobrevin domain-containing protein [Cavenderia fasciculata]
MDKVHSTQQQVDQVAGVMHNAIGTMIDNQTKVSELQQKSENMKEGAAQFKKKTNEVKRLMWCRNMKITLIIALVVLIILAIIIIPIVLKFT